MRPLAERIEEKVERVPEAGCWLWTGNLSHDGYPYMYVAGRKQYMHRVCYELRHGERIGVGLTLDHLCRVRNCVNPEHMEPMPLLENIARGNYGWRASLTHCKRGHELAGENLYRWRNSRICLTCRKSYKAAA